jgi:uncharacterized membrane protein YgcG
MNSQLGDMIQLKNQEVEVVQCEDCDALMVNIDQKQLAPGDIDILKIAGVRLSNPETEDAICINCEINREESEHTFKRKIKNYMDEDDDSSSSHHSDDSFFGGGSFGGGLGGFGGFGGGSFSGGGASGGW